MNHIQAIFLSCVAGTIYYKNMSLSIPKESNCSFSANVWTDIGAFIAGAILIYRGTYLHNDPITTFIGTTIVVEHIWQLFHNKM